MSWQAEAFQQSISDCKYWNCDPDPSRCICGGTGWFCSDFDTFESCLCHSGPHPLEVEYAREMVEYAQEMTCRFMTGEETTDEFQDSELTVEWRPNWRTEYDPFAEVKQTQWEQTLLALGL